MLWCLPCVAVLVLGSAVMASAQSAPPSAEAQPEAEPRTLKERLKEPDQAGGFHVTRHFAVVFGGIKRGSGIALGPALSHRFEDGGFTQIKGVYSVRNFKLLQARYDSRRFWSERAMVTSRVRWQDAPELSLYPVGPGSANRRAEYAETKTETSSRFVAQLSPLFSLTAGAGIERYTTTRGRIDASEGADALPEVPSLPGLGTRPWFVHTFVALAADTRESPDYSRSGRFAEAALHDYHDWRGGQDSFRRVEGTVQQLVPTYAGRGVIDLSARTWISLSRSDRSVPFFLMPTLGGGELLRAYSGYRFRDRDALHLAAEYRWAVHENADLAGLYEAGKVSPTLKGLNLDRMAQSIAIGVRVHSRTSSLFRADLAYGGDGFGFRVGVSAGGS